MATRALKLRRLPVVGGPFRTALIGAWKPLTVMYSNIFGLKVPSISVPWGLSILYMGTWTLWDGVFPINSAWLPRASLGLGRMLTRNDIPGCSMGYFKAYFHGGTREFLYSKGSLRFQELLVSLVASRASRS